MTTNFGQIKLEVIYGDCNMKILLNMIKINKL